VNDAGVDSGSAGRAAGRPLTDFEEVLLGTIVGGPSSGYDLKKLFTTTPAAIYQPSPGALYPALRRLEHRGLLRARPDVSAGRRGRRVYHATKAGRAAHLAWIRQPVVPGTVVPDLDLHLMRFVMMEQQLPRADVLAFLASLADALAGFVADVERYLATAAMPGRHPPLALEHGIAVHRASLDWARSAMAALAEANSADEPDGGVGQ
jgi:DNA-binding PadR family transcriptional regulator